MKLLLGTIAVLIVVGGAAFFMFGFETKLEAPPADAVYRQSTASADARIEDLLSKMTLKEKLGQMALVDKNSVLEPEDVSRYGLGALLSGFGAKPENNTPEGWHDMVSGFITQSKMSRLGIPILYGADAIHGHTNVPGATVFPHSIGLGATGDVALVESVARATAEEMAATGVNWSYSPTLDLPRDIRWGRTYEAFSDDSKLVSKLGAAYVRGTQKMSDTSDTNHIFVLSTPKHFVGVGSMMWGSSSNKNFKIDQGTTAPNKVALDREYIPPFKATVDVGAMSVMVGLNSWGSQKLSADTDLVTTLLKHDLAFDGFTVSDWYAVYEVPGNDYESAVTAINAGIDMVMLPFDYKPFIKNMEHAVKKGDISEERIDDAVRRILRAKFALGLFDANTAKPALKVVGSSEHRALARTAVAESLVLLKNEKAILPIRNSVKRIQIAGSAADNVGRQSGAWTVEWQGIDKNWLPGSTSILQGIKDRAGNSITIDYEKNARFTEGDRAEVGIAIVGEAPYAEGWGDKEYPTLDSEDLETIKRLQSSCDKVIVILVSGRPLLIANEIDSWDGVVAAWLPGSEGEGVADVLFGDKPFTGTLPLPWPHHSEQLPITADGITADKTPLLFPRYFGLQ